MKSWARQYLWWPKLDDEIEMYAKNCESCLLFSSSPNKARLSKLPKTSKVFEIIHLDFLGPFKGHTYLIITDAFSKWVEVFKMDKSDTRNTLNKLRECIARFGLPDLIFSDNGTQFTSEEFTEFCNKNGIRFQTSPPGHRESNGADENSVKTFKRSLSKLLSDSRNEGCCMDTLVAKFLF